MNKNETDHVARIYRYLKRHILSNSRRPAENNICRFICVLAIKNFMYSVAEGNSDLSICKS